MAIYVYKAVDKKGHHHHGLQDADNVRQLRKKLRSQGWTPISLSNNSPSKASRTVERKTRAVFSTAALTQFTRDLSILLEGGLHLEKALQLLAMQAPNARMRDTILTLRSQITEGISYADALAKYPNDFPQSYCVGISIGERVGDLSGILNKLAEHGEKHSRMLNKVKLAMMYPIILAGFALVVVIGMMVYVFPEVMKSFISSGQPLPLLTVMLMNFSKFLNAYGLILLLVLAVLSLAANQWLKKTENQLQWHKKLLRLPLISRLIIAINLAQYTGTLSLLRSSGVPMSETLKIAGDVMSNLWLRKNAQQVTRRVIEGMALSQAMRQTGYFPLPYTNMISSGEASGELDRILKLTAINQMDNLEKQMMFGVAILEPTIILVLGLMVLLIVLAIMLPILSMNQLVK